GTPNQRGLGGRGGGVFPRGVGLCRGFSAGGPGGGGLAPPPPLDYARWFYYDTMLLYAPAVRYLADTMGGERVLLGSDYPFDVGDPDPTAVVRDAGLDEATQATVLGGACCGLFHLA